MLHGFRKSLLVLVLVFGICSVLVFSKYLPVKAERKTIVVPDDYLTIHEAIQNANEWDTVYVKSGMYDGPVHETWEINKPISIICEENTTVRVLPMLYEKMMFGYVPYKTYGTSILITADNVTISGLTVTIPVFESISPGGTFYITANGFELIKCRIYTHISITGNCSTISESIIHSGIYLSGLDLNGSNNIIQQCSISDLGITGSYNNIIGNNIGYHITMDHGSSNLISGNSFKKGSLEFSVSNTICNNTIKELIIGIHGWTSSNNTFYGNIFDAPYNRGPNIISGFYNVWDNGVEGNYWDDYSGIDADGDGIGDTPYVIDEENQDNFPLMEPPVATIPEFPSGSILLLVLVACPIIILLKVTGRKTITKRTL